MARIIGVEVPPNKRIDIALRYIYGIGPVNALEILERANIDRSVRAKDLTEAQLSQIVHAIQDGKYVIEGDLRRELGMNLKRLQGINPPLYRLRAQDHRIFFRDLGDSIEVTRIRDRKDAYR